VRRFPTGDTLRQIVEQAFDAAPTADKEAVGVEHGEPFLGRLCAEQPDQLRPVPGHEGHHEHGFLERPCIGGGDERVHERSRPVRSQRVANARSLAAARALGFRAQARLTRRRSKRRTCVRSRTSPG